MRYPVDDLFDPSTPMGVRVAAALAARQVEMAAYEAAINTPTAPTATASSESNDNCPFCGQVFVGSDLVFRVGPEPYPEKFGYAHQACWSAANDGGMTHQAPPIGPNGVQERGGWFAVRLLPNNGGKLYFATGDR